MKLLKYFILLPFLFWADHLFIFILPLPSALLCYCTIGFWGDLKSYCDFLCAIPTILSFSIPLMCSFNFFFLPRTHSLIFFNLHDVLIFLHVSKSAFSNILQNIIISVVSGSFLVTAVHMSLCRIRSSGSNYFLVNSWFSFHLNVL